MTSPASASITEKQYHEKEMRRFVRECDQIRNAPLWERKEAQAELAGFWRDDPKVFAERCRWVLEGQYGYGASFAARGIANTSKRSNRTAQLSQLTALLECRCPENMTRVVWNGLNAEQQAALTASIDAELADWAKAEAEENEQ